MLKNGILLIFRSFDVKTGIQHRDRCLKIVLNDFLDDFLLDREIWFSLAKSKMVYERLYSVNSGQKMKIQKISPFICDKVHVYG